MVGSSLITDPHPTIVKPPITVLSFYSLHATIWKHDCYSCRRETRDWLLHCTLLRRLREKILSVFAATLIHVRTSSVNKYSSHQKQYRHRSITILLVLTQGARRITAILSCQHSLEFEDPFSRRRGTTSIYQSSRLQTLTTLNTNRNPEQIAKSGIQNIFPSSMRCFLVWMGTISLYCLPICPELG